MNIISEVKRAGLTIWLKPNGRIGVAPVERLTDDLRRRITDNRRDVIAALQTTHHVIDAAENDVSELTRLVRQCGDAYSFTADEHREALQIALNDPVSALTCFRAMARRITPVNSTATRTTISNEGSKST